MDYLSQSAFYKKLRALIESADFDGAERWIADGIAAANDADLRAALKAPLEAMHIEKWHSIGNSIKIGNWRLPPSERGWMLSRVYVGLLNHSGLEAPLAEVKFGFLPCPPPNDPSTNVCETDEREYKVNYVVPMLCVSGLELAWMAQMKRPCHDETQDQMSERWRRQTLAAAIILLRFHQLIERYAARPNFPRQVDIVAHVAHVDWPMEQGIYVYGTDATRHLQSNDPQMDGLMS